MWFVSNAKLEEWVEQGADFQGDSIALPNGTTHSLVPAVRIISLIDGQDTHGLVGQVKLLSDIQNLGGEHFQGTVIVGDDGYECEEGFADPSPPSPAQSSAAATAATDEALSSLSGGSPDDAEMLADFWLKNLD